MGSIRAQGDLDAVDMPTGILLIKVIEATDIPNMVRPGHAGPRIGQSQSTLQLLQVRT
jgi:hypothetical protein